MTQRTTARHRDDRPTSTPLSGLTQALQAVSLAPTATVASRGGLAIAVSSGLVAALPAAGALQTDHQVAATTGSVPALSPVAEALASTAVTAPADATVSFERGTLRPVGKHAAPSATPAAATTDVSRVSRDLARTAYRAAQVKAQVSTVGAAGRTTTPSAPPARSSVPVRAAGNRGDAVVAIALRYLGVPYLYGGASPRGFDCSGFSLYVYRQIGVTLPRTAQQQYNATTRISRSLAVPGDLVFFFTGGSVTHLGIYLGGNMMIAAPHTGDVVKRQDIYSANVAFGRV